MASNFPTAYVRVASQTYVLQHILNIKDILFARGNSVGVFKSLYFTQQPRYKDKPEQQQESSGALWNPACLDDNTAYYGNSLKILDGYNSSSECQMHCDKFSGCTFWSFMKSNGRCFLKNSKVPQARFMYFTFTITLLNLHVWCLDTAMIIIHIHFFVLRMEKVSI